MDDGSSADSGGIAGADCLVAFVWGFACKDSGGAELRAPIGAVVTGWVFAFEGDGEERGASSDCARNGAGLRRWGRKAINVRVYVGVGGLEYVDFKHGDNVDDPADCLGSIEWLERFGEARSSPDDGSGVCREYWWTGNPDRDATQSGVY